MSNKRTERTIESTGTPKVPRKVIQPRKDVGVYFTDPRPTISAAPTSLLLNAIDSAMKALIIERPKAPKDVVMGPTSSLQPVTVIQNSSASTLQAIEKRLDVKPNEKVGAAFKRGAARLMEITPALKPIVVDDALIEKWLVSLTHEKQEACREVLRGAVHWQGSQDREVFAKSEILLKPEQAQARLIHNGNPVVAVLMGAITNELQNRAKKVLSEVNPGQKEGAVKMYFPCGLSDKQIAEFRTRVRQGKGSVLEGDFSKNDATQPPDLREYEAMWYHKLGAPEWYARECIGLKDMNVFSRTLGMVFEIRGQRHSGEEAGTIGNTFNALCCLSGSLIESGARGIVTAYGDDTEVWLPDTQGIVPETVAGQAVADAKDHGMILEVALPPKELATFLQTRVLIGDSGESFPVPKLGRYLSKVNVRANFNPDISDNDYMGGKYLSLAHQYRFMPSISGRFLSTSQALTSTPYLAKDWNPGKKLPGDLFEETASVRRPMTSSDEERVWSVTYGLGRQEVLETVDLFCAGAVLRASEHAKFGDRAHFKSALSSYSKAVLGRVSVFGDIDTPAVARMIQVDNRDLLVTVK